MNEERIEASHVLEAYPVFRYLAYLRKIGLATLIEQNVFITLIMVMVLIAAAVIDKTLFLEGKNVGLFEHPAIWAFIVAQAVVPIFLAKAINGLLHIPQWDQSFIAAKFLREEFADFIEGFKNDVNRKTNLSRALYSLFIAIGFVSFVWNSYQNQLPIRFLGFDFWDSINYPCGYWGTRFYKFYLWIILFPSIAHMQVLILLTIRKIVKRAALGNNLILNPYDQDNCGGASVFIDTMLKPVIPILVISSALALCVVIVHKKFDPTTLLSLALTNILFLTLYFIPAISFRKAIQHEKKRQLGEISTIQNEFLLSVYGKEGKLPVLEKSVDLVNSLVNVSQQIRLISNWPHLRSLLKLQSLILSPSIVGATIKFMQPVIAQVLQR